MPSSRGDPAARPYVGRRKTCASCGREFLCYERGCWCDAVKTSPAEAQSLREKFEDCLCEACLRALPPPQHAE